MPWTWNTEREGALTGLWLQGLSATDIAARLMELYGGQLTRSAVIGKKLRMGLRNGPERAPYKPRPHPRTPRPEPKTARRWGVRVPAAPKADPRSLHDLEDWQCHFPVKGAGLSALFCGSKRYHYGGKDSLKLITFPYCYYHCHVAYKWSKAPPPPEEQEAA